MSKKVNLPYLSIEGVGATQDERLDSLIRCEMLLVMLGYDSPDEEWNNRYAEFFSDPNCHVCTPHILNKIDSPAVIKYHTHAGVDGRKYFSSTDLEGIAAYVESFKNK